MRLMCILFTALLILGCNQGDTKQAAKEEGSKVESSTSKEATTSEATEGDKVEGDYKTSGGQALDTKQALYGYLIGTNIGTNFKNDHLDVDLEMVLAGMSDAMSESITLSDEDMGKLMQDFQTDMMESRKKRMEEEKVVNKAAAEQFLSENKGKEGVKETASGLQYKVESAGGKTEKPAATSQVKVHYRGTLLDGKEFDSSYKRNQPATFPLNGVIPGWTEGLQLMSPGDKYTFYIKPDLAYGPNGQRNIPPNALLIFEVELLEIL